MSEQLANKVALVTGSTRGIGRAITTRFLSEGCKVVGIYRTSDDEAQRLSDLYPVFLPVKFDLRDISNIGSIVGSLPSGLQKIDILVNNAGIKRRVGFMETTPDIWAEVMNINLQAPYFLTQAVARGMVARRSGRIINITSQADPNLTTSSLEYGLSKSGLAHFTRVAAKMLAPHGITVNAISPGRTYTDLTGYDTNPEKEQQALRGIPLGHINSPSEIADIALFLAGETGRNITGQIIAIDGGEVIR